MNKKRDFIYKFIVNILILALLVGTPTSVNATERIPEEGSRNGEVVAAADKLYKLGLFEGTGLDSNGKPIYDLDRPMTRVEAITMLVRLIGKDKIALGSTWTTPFNDVPKWAEPFIGYAYENGLTYGIAPTIFGSHTTISATEYITFVLRALRYSTGIDFKWNEAWVLSNKLGITQGEYNSSSDVCMRADAVLISAKALDCNIKESNLTMLDNIKSTTNLKYLDWEECNIEYVMINNQIFKFDFLNGIDIINPIAVGPDKELYISTYIPIPRNKNGDKRVDHCSSILAILNLMVGEYKIVGSENPFLNGILELNTNDILHENLNQEVNIEFDIAYNSLTNVSYSARYTYNGITLKQSDLIQESSGVRGVYMQNDFQFYNPRPYAKYLSVNDLLKYFKIEKTIKIGSYMNEYCYIIE